MAFHEAFKQLQARTLQTKLKSTGTDGTDEGVKTEHSFGPWGAIHDSATAMKSEGLTGGVGCGDGKCPWETYCLGVGPGTKQAKAVFVQKY